MPVEYTHEQSALEALPAQMRAQVDDLVMKGSKLQAVKVIREALGEPRPGLYECLDLVAERFEALGQRFTRSPTAPLDLDELMANVRALPHAPAAIEALWDGDSEGWMVYLLAVTIEPRAEYHLAIIQHGTDLRLFNGEVRSALARFGLTASGRSS
ncbi:hypothetical protein ABZ897_04105 [Nonomuraea sp. NPDC046802]|uniref:hypothetical protein n=1 Tax=Nonomuraea sp. NPDC046802 TaxID=3154919 RepID=UPI0033D03065